MTSFFVVDLKIQSPGHVATYFGASTRDSFCMNQNNIKLSKLIRIVKHVRIQSTKQNLSYSEGQYFHDRSTTVTPICKLFAKGMCKRGNSFFFSHVDQAKQELLVVVHANLACTTMACTTTHIEDLFEDLRCQFKVFN